MPDWPTTYGQNMFTFPVSKWVGGILFEHAHRLIASTVGMLTIVLAVWLAGREPRRWVRRLGYLALAAVVAQGVLGGLTVIFLLPPAISVAHACLAQTFFCLDRDARGRDVSPLADAAPDGSEARRRRRPRRSVGLIFLQLLVGAVMRHTKAGLAIPDFPLAFGRVVPPLTSFAVGDPLRAPRAGARRGRRRVASVSRGRAVQAVRDCGRRRSCSPASFSCRSRSAP